MTESKVVELFDWIDETATIIQKYKEEPFLDSLAVTLEALFYGDIHDDNNEALQDEVRESLKGIAIESFTTEDIRKAVQLAVLKGMRKATQHHHSMTPEAISLFIGYLADKLMKNVQQVRIFDPASGTGNLLLIVMGHLSQPVKAYASEIDPTLLKISLLNANLQKKRVEYFHQDSLKPLLLDPVDLVVADLPVGYYPDDVQASNFELKTEEGHSYSHHLFIEQSLNYTKEGGFLIFIIPEFLFESEQAEQLHAFLQKHAHIVGLLQLPDTAFTSKEHKKSIFILRKKGEYTQEVQQPLLAMLPSFKNTTAMEDILGQINKWFRQANLF